MADELTGWLCAQCTTDPGLKDRIEDARTEATCRFCGRHGLAMPLEDVADLCHEVFTNFFGLTPADPDVFERLDPSWERHGEAPRDVLVGAAGVDVDVADELVGCLSDDYGYRAVRDGDEDPYGPEARYEAIAADDRTFQDEWLALQRELRERSRFFNSEAEAILGRIFGGLDRLQTFQKQPLVVTVPPNDPNAVFWRARLFMAQDEAEQALVDPAGSIGPPPPQKARAGRMNPAGVAVFYGSQDIDVCLAELRPPVGSWIVACQFRPLRPLRLLDLPALEAIYEEGSYFDLEFRTRRERAAFLSTFCAQVARPVLPGEEDLGYLPTQVIAEYLAEKMHIDGMFYPSTQSGGDRHNVVLFHRAARVRQQPTAEGEEQTGRIDVSEEEIGAVVRVKRMPPAQVAAEKAEALEYLDIPEEAWLHGWQDVALPDDPREASIEVVAGSVYVKYISAVAVDAVSAKVSYMDVSEWA